LQYDLESPVYRHAVRELSRDNSYIRYDERGCGLSDWDVPDYSFDTWVRDLESVVDSLGLERFSLLGSSQGGPVSIAYAVSHPERVSHLILYGAFARGWKRRNLSSEELEEMNARISLTKTGWGRDNAAYRQIFTSNFIPDGTLEQIRWFNDLQRFSTSPENAVRFLTEFGNIDVLDLLPRISVPTLVLHARQDAMIQFERGRQLASMIPTARFVPLEGKNHFLLEDEPAWTQFLREVRHFIGVREEVSSGSPSKAVELGISGWLKGPKKGKA